MMIAMMARLAAQVVKRPTHLAVLAGLAVSVGSSTAVGSGGGSEALPVREPAVAGTFYPGDAKKLRGAVRAYLEQAKRLTEAAPLALLAPHAGYVYSGQIAADAYAHVQGHSYDLVVVLGTNHTQPGFEGVSLFRGRGYRTPLGLVPIDLEATDRLISSEREFRFFPPVHEQEHSVEVQLPFLQEVLPGTAMVSAVVSSSDLLVCKQLGEHLADLAREKRMLLVVSSDLSHYPPYPVAEQIDRQTLKLIRRLDALDLIAFVQGPGLRVHGLATAACGIGPILVMQEYARRVGNLQGRVVSYANSGDTVLGNRDRVVGYGAVVVVPASAPVTEENEPAKEKENALRGSSLSIEDRRFLLRLARRTVQQFVETETVPLPRGGSALLDEPSGVFVTLRKHGELRGCIGRIQADLPLRLAVARTAISAATQDPRFFSVQPGELEDLEFEISILSPPKRVGSADDIVPHRDGVILTKGDRSAVFLPQVWDEFEWEKDEFLDQLCRKAGLPLGCWRSDTEFLTFQADVFSEKDVLAEPLQ